MTDRAEGIRLRPGVWLRGAAAAAVASAALTAPALAQDALRFAITDEPPHLDTHVTTATLTTLVDLHILETLYTFNSSWQPVPLLATGETVSDDGKTVVIGIREGVKFHDGSDLTAEDVVASLERWGAHGGRGKVMFDRVESVEATGDHEVTITFSEVFGPWKNLLAYLNGGPGILPSELVADRGAEPLANEQIIGSGPYKFSEWRPNRHIEIVKYEDYQQPPGDPDGYAGRREVMVDTIQFVPVPDIGTRVSGVQAGDYDYAERIPGDLYEELQQDDSVRTIIQGAPQFIVLFMNNAEGIFKDNYALRRAVLTALNMDEALRIAVGPEDLWAANGSIYPEGTPWYTDNGIQHYNEGDAEKARQMAAEAGYNGEPIRYMVSSSYPLHYDTAQVFEQQLTAAGFNIDFQVYDWATLVERRAEPGLWDMFETTHGFVPDPILITILNDNYPGWWVSPEKEKLEAAFAGSTDLEERKQLWADIQALMYEQVPGIKPGDVFLFDIAAPSLEGVPEEKSTMVWPTFWGVSKS